MPAEDRPKKSLGQHWLRDEAVLRAIADCAEVHAGDHVLEIGPGQGTLTRELLRRGASVTAVELDHQLASGLQTNLLQDGPIDGRLTVVNEDILRFDLSGLPRGYKVVANIPYYLTNNLIRVLCESTNPFSTAALLVQKEVAERAAAVSGQMSLLSVSAQYYCDVSLGPVVAAQFFTPPPKVDSQVLILRRKPGVDADQAKQFFRVVKAGFSQKRKTLLNALSAGLRLDKPAAEALLQQAGITASRRAQTVSLPEWHLLCDAYASQNKTSAKS